MTTQATREYLEHLWKQYKKAGRKLRGKILDEVARNLEIHRKSATRLMSRKYPPRSMQGFSGGRHKQYSERSKKHLGRLWRAMGYMWPQRMKAALADWLVHDDQPDCDAGVKSELLQMSASTIGRLLAKDRADLQRKMNSGTYRGVRKFITKVPIRNLGENITEPGHCEVDCVAHCGGSLSGGFAWTVNMTDTATGWTECESIWAKNGKQVRRALKAMEKRLPFPLKALYFDNGCEFMNEEIIDGFAVESRAARLPVFRGRPYKKNDQAYIEQKNYTHVRHLFGYGRISWEKSVGHMNDIYRKEWRILQNFYMPQQKLASKIRIGSKIIRKMSSPLTPYERLKPFLSPKKLQELEEERKVTNPFKCRHNQRIKVKRLFNHYKDEIKKSEWGKMALAFAAGGRGAFKKRW